MHNDVSMVDLVFSVKFSNFPHSSKFSAPTKLVTTGDEERSENKTDKKSMRNEFGHAHSSRCDHFNQTLNSIEFIIQEIM